ncbi:hypothetical protein [Hymenobacter rubidus]|uniref:hypothetical protein n=1 Tax=Hymenobacter rubidus TaxID=1441626 RepID=UPI00191D2E68|nr:hypothetical protein [Hymenobacter rubidus]
MALLTVLFSYGCTTSAQAQTSPAADIRSKPAKAAPTLWHNILKFNPPALLVQSVSVFYEHALTDRLSVVVGYNCAGKNYGFSRAIEKDGSGFRRGTIEVRRYGKGAGLQGFYLGSYLRLGKLRDGYYVYDPPSQHITGEWRTEENVVGVLGFMAGIQVIVLQRFTLDGFAGLQAQHVFGEVNSANEFVEVMTGGLNVRAGVTVGVAF